MATTSNLEVADIIGNLIAQIIYDAIYNSHSDIDDIKKSVNALLQVNQEVLERLYNDPKGKHRSFIPFSRRIRYYPERTQIAFGCRFHTRNCLRRFRRLGRA